MPDYTVNAAGVAHARELIDAGEHDDTTEWSEAAPSAAEENQERDDEGQEGYAEWHLAVDESKGEGTKGRYRFPYGDFSTVNRAALIHAKQRAAQNGHRAIERAADELLQRLDARRG
jgi:creatinine amidohydrolase/Fe(II)-dependent formamide hydrolase-like protein